MGDWGLVDPRAGAELAAPRVFSTVIREEKLVRILHNAANGINMVRKYPTQNELFLSI